MVGWRARNVRMLSISERPCWPTVIVNSSPSGEIVTVSEAAGGEEGKQNPLGIDWDGISCWINIFEAGHLSTMKTARCAELGWWTRTRRYSCYFNPTAFFSSMLSTIQRTASGRAQMSALQSLTCDLRVVVGNRAGIWGTGGTDMKIWESKWKRWCKLKAIIVMTMYVGQCVYWACQ